MGKLKTNLEWPYGSDCDCSFISLDLPRDRETNTGIIACSVCLEDFQTTINCMLCVRIACPQAPLPRCLHTCTVNKNVSESGELIMCTMTYYTCVVLCVILDNRIVAMTIFNCAGDRFGLLCVTVLLNILARSCHKTSYESCYNMNMVPCVNLLVSSGK